MTYPFNRKVPMPTTTEAEANGKTKANSKTLPRSLISTANVFKLLCDPVRLQILVHLQSSGPTYVGDLCNLLNQPQPAISHHLSLLRVSGLVEAERKGKRNYYAISPSSPIGAILEAVG